jgi:ABC-type antimicrobial peptide transport system permease subunit
LTGNTTIIYLTEAIVISTVGGVIGVGLGIGFAFAAATAFKFPFIVPLWSIGAGFSLSFVVGILAGGIPARNAAKLDPIRTNTIRDCSLRKDWIRRSLNKPP